MSALKIKGWVARNGDGRLTLFTERPEYDSNEPYTPFWHYDGFPGTDLTFDIPIITENDLWEVELEITAVRKDNENT